MSNSTPTVGIVLTTINGGEIIGNLAKNILRHGHREHVTIYAIPDVITPDAFFSACDAARAQGIRVESPTMQEQETFLKTLPSCPPIPERTDNRRNVGFLMAMRDKCDVVLSMDDDNFFDEELDAIGDHCARLSSDSKTLPVAESSTHFWNCCEFLPFKVSHPVYPRGYPLGARHIAAQTTMHQTPMPTWINAGLWLEAPDIDAFLWLAGGKTLRCTEWEPKDLRLGQKTWCPINSQNTAIIRELMPAYYYLPMSSPGLEMPIDRYGDILSGYFALACAKAHGATVNFGAPAARHIRNVHNYMSDFRREMLCLSIIDELLEWLRSVELTGTTVAQTYDDLATKLDAHVELFRERTWTPGLRAHFHFMAQCMHQWVETIGTLVP